MITLKFDVFGFSRGSTEARLLINFLQIESKKAVKAFDNQVIDGFKKDDVEIIVKQLNDCFNDYLQEIDNKKDYLQEIDNKKDYLKTINSIISEAEKKIENINNYESEKKIIELKELETSIEQLENQCSIFIDRRINKIECSILGIYDTVSSIGVLNKMNIGMMKRAINSIKRLDVRDWYDGIIDFGANSILLMIDKFINNSSFSHSENVSNLGLRNIKEVQNVLHICAADEYRENFALVSIGEPDNSGMVSETVKGVEIYIPGCHADIGGGYPDGQAGLSVLLNDNYAYEYKKCENKNSKDNNYILSIKEALKSLWGATEKKDENNNKESYYTSNSWNPFKWGCFEFVHYPKKGYNYVTLQVMQEWANNKNNRIAFKNFNDRFSVSDIKLKNLQETIMKEIENDGVKGSLYSPIVPEKWDYLSIRKEYLHFSASYARTKKIAHVNTPNYKIIDGLKVYSRQIY